MVARNGARGEAPGKLILFGEHAVVYGAPALGMPLARTAVARVKPGEGRVTLKLGAGLQAMASPHAAQPQDLIARALGDRMPSLDVDLTLNFPPMSGFGSSAALAIAALRGLEALDAKKPASPRRLLAQTLQAETVAHAKPSGVDPAICVWGAPIRFDKQSEGADKIRKLKVKTPVTLLVGSAGAHGGTRQTVSRLAELRKSDAGLITSAMDALGAASVAGQEALRRGDLARLGRAMDVAQGVLMGLGLVSEQVHQAANHCREAGALGAKMSGAGGAGGAFYGVFEDAKSAAKAKRQLKKLGHFSWIETLAT